MVASVRTPAAEARELAACLRVSQAPAQSHPASLQHPLAIRLPRLASVVGSLEQLRPATTHRLHLRIILLLLQDMVLPPLHPTRPLRRQATHLHPHNTPPRHPTTAPPRLRLVGRRLRLIVRRAPSTVQQAPNIVQLVRNTNQLATDAPRRHRRHRSTVRPAHATLLLARLASPLRLRGTRPPPRARRTRIRLRKSLLVIVVDIPAFKASANLFTDLPNSKLRSSMLGYLSWSFHVSQSSSHLALSKSHLQFTDGPLFGERVQRFVDCPCPHTESKFLLILVACSMRQPSSFGLHSTFL